MPRLGIYSFRWDLWRHGTAAVVLMGIHLNIQHVVEATARSASAGTTILSVGKNMFQLLKTRSGAINQLSPIEIN